MGGTPLRVRAFAQVGEPFQHLLMGETPKTAMLHQRNCFTTTLCSPSTTKGYPPQRVIDEACFARKDASSASESVGGGTPLKGTVEVGRSRFVYEASYTKADLVRVFCPNRRVEQRSKAVLGRSPMSYCFKTAPLNGGVSSPQKLPSATQVSHHRNGTVSQRASGICSRGLSVRRRCQARKEERPRVAVGRTARMCHRHAFA